MRAHVHLARSHTADSLPHVRQVPIVRTGTVRTASPDVPTRMASSLRTVEMDERTGHSATVEHHH
jgi:ribosomal protein S19E (S16A)